MSKAKESVQSFWKKSAAIALVICGLWFAVGANNVKAQIYTEGFETVPPAGWTVQNNSSPTGPLGWHQGSSTVFPAHQGLPNSYAVSDSNSTIGNGMISNWLISPNWTFRNGDRIKFWTRTFTANPFPDRMQVRLSLAGASTNVGTSPTSVGNFTNLLVDINPNYETGGVYPEVWTEFTITLSGLTGPASGRVAFRHFVGMSESSNIVGIDTFSYIPVPSAVNAPNDVTGDGKSDFIIVRADGTSLSKFIGANDIAGKNKVENMARREELAPQAGWGWWIADNNATPISRTGFGIESDFTMIADVIGDNKDDLVVWSSGAPTVAGFKVLDSGTFTVSTFPFGQTGDDPTILGDFSGDGKEDLVVYRDGTSVSPQSFFFWATAANPAAVNYIAWGTDGDVAYTLDYNGDGKHDAAVQRNGGNNSGDHYIRLTSIGTMVYVNYGLASDLIVPGDYDGDGRDDICVSRNADFGNGIFKYFWVRESDGGVTPQPTYQWGIQGDLITQGDWDGDGKTDVGVWRSNPDPTLNFFYGRRSSDGGLLQVKWGISGDYPVNNWDVH